MNRFLILAIVIFIISNCRPCKNIELVNSLEEGLILANQEEKPILLIFDFLGNPTLSTEKLLHRKDLCKDLDDYIIVYLNVDESDEKGNVYRRLQIEKFGTNTQPMYYILNHSGKVIKDPLGYCKISEFKEFIR